MIGAVVAALLAAGDDDSAYEKTLIEWGMKQHRAVIETEPEGKVIEQVLTAREDVFSESDPVPTWLNIFHGRTRESVVLRWVLLKKGEKWSQALAYETERNLRTLVIFAVAKVIAVKGPKGGVVALIITKDRWSFRANWEYLLVGDVLEYLHVPITEVNLLGQGIEATFDPYLRRDTLMIGEEVVWRRFLGTRLQVRQALGLFFNREVLEGRYDSGLAVDDGRRQFVRQKPALEGSYGVAQVSQPLLSLDQKWGFNAYGAWDIRPIRIFRGHQVQRLVYPGRPAAVVPYEFDRRNIDVGLFGTRRLRFADVWRLDVSAGTGGFVHQATPREDLGPIVTPWFVSTRLPRTEDAVFLYAHAQLFTARFVQKHNLETFGLTEDLQIGPRLIVAAQWAVPVIAPSHFINVGATLRWRVLLGENLFQLSAAAAARLRPGSSVVNEHYAFEVTNWSPPFEGGRFVTRVLTELRQHDLDNNQVILGAGLGLRGTPSGSYVGRNMVLGNFEYRTRPFNITTLLAGLVLFYDVGSAWDVGGPQLTHTVGIGLRILIPQLNTQVIRLDLGFVLNGDADLTIDRFSSTFGQVTHVRPSIFDDPF